MTLIPAGQCFLKFVSNFLSGNNSTADDSNNRSRENEHESLELFRNSLTQRSSLFSQDWDKVHFNMLRSTSLQNFSVSHFNFFPTGSHVENVYRTSTPPRSQIEHNYLTSLSPESRFENHFHASPSPEPQEKHCSEKDLIDNHQQTISVMEDSLKLYENDVSYLENNIQALRNKSQESDKLIRELERNVSRLNKLLERKESDLAEANRKVHNYHKYYCWSLVQIANLMKEENSLRDENINLLLLMEECCSDNEYCEEKLKEYQEKLNMIEKEMSELTMDIERRNQSFQEEKAKSADATAKLRAENESLKVQCEVQTSEAAKCSQMMTLYKKRIEQVKHLLETKTYEISNLEKNINLFEDKLNQAEKDKDNALNELESIKTENKDLTETTRRLTETIAQLETSLGESKAQMTTLCETLTLVRDELKQSQDENQQLKLSLNNMEDELNSTKLSYETKLKQKNTELTIIRDELTRSTNQLRDQLDQLSVELAQCQGTQEAWHTELDMVRTELKCKNELSRVLEEQHQRLNLSYEALYKEFTDAMAELTERKEELSQLNEAMTKMKQHNEVLKQIEVDFKTREQNLEQVVLEKLKSFESEVLEKTETISRLEEQNNKYEIQIKQLSEQIDAQSKDINQLRENIQVKNEEIKQLREDIYVKNEEITRLNEDIQVKNEGISRLKDKLTTVEHADNSMNTGYDILCTDKKSPDTTSIINAQEILSLLEINSAHCKRYHALEKAYRELSLECSALHRTLSASPALSAPPSACLSNECSAYVSQIKKLSEENKYLQATLSDYKRINSLLLDQIKVSVHHPVLEDSLPPQTLLNTRYNIAEKEDNSSTLSVDDRNTADLWWENEVNIPHALTYDNLPCTETKSL